MRCLVRGFGSLVLGAWCLALPILAAEPWFGLSFADYAAGERLSDKGATGGVWGAQQGSATNAPVAGVNAMAVASDDLPCDVPPASTTSPDSGRPPCA